VSVTETGSDGSPAVEVVSPEGERLGSSTKLAVHKAPGVLHRAFSAFLSSDRGRVLLQRRGARKYHFASLWSNACCSHPTSERDVLAAAQRRTREELRLEATFRQVGTFLYRAVDPVSGLVEMEYDHVLVGVAPLSESARVDADADEVDATRWIALDELYRELADAPLTFAPWFRQALEIAEPHLVGSRR
jgi:isopentenyl-diphosphate delta-isomerase